MKPFLTVSTLEALLVAGILGMSAGQNANAAESNAYDNSGAQAGISAMNPVCATDELNRPTAQAEHSSAATAHKTLNDPNNQLGTSLSGRTRGPDNCVMTAQADTSQIATIDGEAIE
jgi:hypothetical protein